MRPAASDPANLRPTAVESRAAPLKPRSFVLSVLVSASAGLAGYPWLIPVAAGVVADAWGAPAKWRARAQAKTREASS
jgi:hypothetical protein